METNPSLANIQRIRCERMEAGTLLDQDDLPPECTLWRCVALLSQSHQLVRAFHYPLFHQKLLHRPREAQRHIEDINPCITLILYMCLYCPLIGVKTHEEPASGGKLVKIGWQRRDEGLQLRRMCQVAQVIGDRHETLVFEWNKSTWGQILEKKM